MILSIIALIINVTLSIVNVRYACRNRRRAERLDAIENELIEYAFRMSCDTSGNITNEQTPESGFAVVVEVDDPAIIHELMMMRLFSTYSPN